MKIFVFLAEDLAQKHNVYNAQKNHELAKKYTSREVYNIYRKYYENILRD